MSFILDALKKSESDRQRQSGPALFEVKLAPPRTGLPSWAIAVGALLLVNLAVVMWMLLRHSAARTATPPAATSGVSAPAAAPASFTGSSSAGGPALPVPPTAMLPPAATLPARSAAPAATAAPGLPSQSAPAVAAPGPGLAAAPAAGAHEDFAPASEPASSAALGPRVRRGTADGVPLYQESAAAADAHLPLLRLDLHVFAARNQDRFVMINMHRLREGDSLPEGVQVESITPDGAVLSYKGSRFLLPR